MVDGENEDELAVTRDWSRKSSKAVSWASKNLVSELRLVVLRESKAMVVWM